MDRSNYIYLSAAELFVELSEKHKLHLLNDLERDGWITPTQRKDVKALKEALHDNSKVATRRLPN